MVGRTGAAAGLGVAPLTAARHDSSGGRGFPATLPMDQPALSIDGGENAAEDVREGATVPDDASGSKRTSEGGG